MPVKLPLDKLVKVPRGWILEKTIRGSSDPVWVIRRVKRYGKRIYKYHKDTKEPDKVPVTAEQLRDLVKAKHMTKKAAINFKAAGTTLSNLFSSTKKFLTHPVTQTAGGLGAGAYWGNNMYQGQVKQIRAQAIQQRYNELMGNQDPNQGLQ